MTAFQRLLVLWFLFALWSLFACKTENSQQPSQVKEFQNVEEIESADVDLILPLAQSVIGDRARVRRIFLKPLQTEDAMAKDEQYFYRIEFGLLSQNEFEALKKAYGSVSEQIYDAQRRYKLEDFLHPQIQALNEHRFISQSIQDSRDIQLINDYYLQATGSQDQEVYPATQSSLSTNCWGTVWEIVRGDRQEIALFYAPNFIVEQYMQDPEYSSEILSAEQFETNPTSGVVQPGDVLLVSGKWGNRFSINPLLHAAVKVDGDVYFEKTGTSSGFVYRFVHLTDIQKVYPRDASLYSFRRFHKPLPDPTQKLKLTLNTELTNFLKARLPDNRSVESVFDRFIVNLEPAGMMGSSSFVSLSHMDKAKLLKDRFNRYSLDLSAYDAKTFAIGRSNL